MSAELVGDPIDPNPPVTLAGPDYSAWYPSATAANVVSYPDHYAAVGAVPYPGYAGYSGYPATGIRRPGEAVTAAVLSLISAALLLITGFVIIFAASTLDDPNNALGSPDQARLFVGAGLMNVVTAAVLIVGAVLLLGRARGRAAIVIGTLLCVSLGLFWLTEDHNGGGLVVWLVIFCGPVITATVLVATDRVSNWLDGVPSR